MEEARLTLARDTLLRRLVSRAAIQMNPRAPFAPDAILGQEQLATLLESVQELLAILSPEGIIQFVSAGFTRLLGHNAEDLAGGSILDLVHPNDAQGARDCLRELAASQQEKFGKRCRLRSKDGSWRWF